MMIVVNLVDGLNCAAQQPRTGAIFRRTKMMVYTPLTIIGFPINGAGISIDLKWSGIIGQL